MSVGKIHLETITVIGRNNSPLTYPTLIEEWKDIVGLAILGIDPDRRKIVSFQIKGIDGKVRSYTPEVIRGMA